MSLGADVAAHLPRLRAEAESRMVDQCEIGTFTQGEPDPVTLAPTEVLADAHYSGKCRIKSSSNAVSDRDAGNQSYAAQSFILSVPVADGGDIATDDTLLVTAVDPITGNPSMVDKKFRIAGLAAVSQATAARFSLELIS